MMDHFLHHAEDHVILYNGKFDEYGISVCDGGSSVITINYCPWCGKRLPDSKRELWFAELQELGFEDPLNERIPHKYQSAEWYLNRED